MKAPANLSSLFDWNSGTVDGTGLTTSALVNLNAGSLNTDWLITSSGVVDWTGNTSGDLIITDATITNQGEFKIAGQSNVNTSTANQANKNFSASSLARFINQGILLIDGGDDTVEFDLTFENIGGTIEIVSGIFKLADNVDLELGQGATLQGFGTFDGNVVNTAGIVTPGNVDPANVASETGTLTITGNYTQGVDGTLLIKLDIIDQVLLSDQLAVTGLFTADGAINFSIVNNAPVDQVAEALLVSGFTPVSFGTFAGRFSDTNVPAGLGFTFNDDGTISIVPTSKFEETTNEVVDLIDSGLLDFTEIVEAMKFLEQIEIVIIDSEDDDDDEERAPRLVCK